MKVWILNTLDYGVDTTNLLLGRMPITGMIGLSQREPGDAVSGYLYLKEYCHTVGLEWMEVKRYDLKSDADRKALLALDIDILVTLGWQRLIPEWLIEHCRLGAIGAHGSASGITAGRGRSPQNWALILGKTQFDISIFWTDPGIDSGAVIDSRTFEYDHHDTIQTSYYKVGWHVADMLVENYHSGRLESHQSTPQESSAYYLPQRKPEDGEIDWSRSSNQVYDFVRALTRPYPGAFSECSRGKLVVWRCHPVRLPGSTEEPGTVVKSYHNGDLLVKTGDGHVLVRDYELVSSQSEMAPSEGEILASADFRYQMRTIIERHQSKYPDLPVAPELMALAGMK